jgi:hypothetical protein
MGPFDLILFCQVKRVFLQLCQVFFGQYLPMIEPVRVCIHQSDATHVMNSLLQAQSTHTGDLVVEGHYVLVVIFFVRRNIPKPLSKQRDQSKGVPIGDVAHRNFWATLESGTSNSTAAILVVLVPLFLAFVFI